MRCKKLQSVTKHFKIDDEITVGRVDWRSNCGIHCHLIYMCRRVLKNKHVTMNEHYYSVAMVWKQLRVHYWGYHAMAFS